MQSQPQFTPEQMIVAARRAEGQGQTGYALQFYQYIADHFSSSTEAYEARDAIYRLTQPVDPATGFGGSMAAPPPSPHQPAMPSPTTSMTDVRPSLDASGGPIHGGNGQGRPTKRKAENRKRRQQVEEDNADSSDFDTGPSYRIGRFVAMMLGTMGWLMLIGAVAMVPLMFAALTVKTFPKGLRETIAGNLVAVGGGVFGLLFLGLFAIFAAQAARATFDTAEMFRQMMAGFRRNEVDSPH